MHHNLLMSNCGYYIFRSFIIFKIWHLILEFENLITFQNFIYNQVVVGILSLILVTILVLLLLLFFVSFIIIFIVSLLLFNINCG